jgi:hypothetical protein
MSPSCQYQSAGFSEPNHRPFPPWQPPKLPVSRDDLPQSMCYRPTRQRINPRLKRRLSPSGLGCEFLVRPPALRNREAAKAGAMTCNCRPHGRWLPPKRANTANGAFAFAPLPMASHPFPPYPALRTPHAPLLLFRFTEITEVGADFIHASLRGVAGNSVPWPLGERSETAGPRRGVSASLGCQQAANTRGVYVSGTPFQGAGPSPLVTGGRRYAVTPGYLLATLRVALQALRLIYNSNCSGGTAQVRPLPERGSWTAGPRTAYPP